MRKVDLREKMMVAESQRNGSKDEAVDYMYFLMTEENYPRRKARRKAEHLFKRKISEDE